MKNTPIISTAGRILPARLLLQGTCSALLVGFMSVSLPVVTSRAQPAPEAPVQKSAAVAEAREELRVHEQPAQLKARRDAEALAAKTNAAIAEEVARRRAHRALIEARQATADQASEAAALPSEKPVQKEGKYVSQGKTSSGTP